MRYVYYSLLFFARFLLFPLYWLSGLVPRRDDLWVFGSWGGHRYADNAAAMFEHCHEQLAGRVRVVWITRRPAIVRELRARGRPAHWLWSPAGMAACLRARLHLFDCFAKDTNFWLSRGAVKVNLWSGVPLKTFERDIDNPRSRYYRLFHGSAPERALLAFMMPWHVQRPDLVIATSAETAAITRRAFGVPAARVAVTGFPRNDALLGAAAMPAGEAPPVFSAAAAGGRRIYLYLPTFRDSGRSALQLDWPALDALMTELGGTLFCKLHPEDRTPVPADLAQVHFLGQHHDVYGLLPRVDVLISDYSSVIFDFMLLDRPIVYHVPDLEQFLADCRGLNFMPEDVAVGPVCRDFAQLAAALRATDASPAAAPARRAEVLARLHEHVDAGACQRVLDEVDRRFFASSLATGVAGAGQVIGA